MAIEFKNPPSEKSALESEGPITPKFNADGLITAIVVDVDDGEVVMLAHMNSQALALTIETGIAHYYSRSRESLWKKGETSGNIQVVKEMRIDCDQDAIIVKVEMTGDGTACHTNRKSCFYRKVEGLNTTSPSLKIG